LLAAVVEAGRSNALAAKLVAITMPGVPDVYQGSELWEQSLVDPDNRRFVNFDHRAAVLAGAADDDAAAKLHLTRAALTLRRDRPELFTTYSPVVATGPAAAHVLAFDRGGAVTVATRLPVGLERAGGWGPTTLDLPPGEWRDVLTGRRVVSRLAASADPVVEVREPQGPSLETTGDLAELLATHPVALLVREDS
jgi:(1->4)-alpha-D-glucan 1-alpha-D-glucosylmutase